MRGEDSHCRHSLEGTSKANFWFSVSTWALAPTGVSSGIETFEEQGHTQSQEKQNTIITAVLLYGSERRTIPRNQELTLMRIERLEAANDTDLHQDRLPQT